MQSRLRTGLLGLNRAMGRSMFMVVFAGMLSGWFWPGLAGLKQAVPWLFGYTTLVMALSISWRGIAKVMAMPGPILRLLGLAHLVMPLVSLVLAGVALGFGSPYTAGLVLATSIPVAVTSVIWTGLARGETALSLTSVALDSLLSPLVVPASVWLFLGHSVQFDSRSLFYGLLWMIVVPTLIGVTLHDLSRGRLDERLEPINGPLSKIALAVVVGVNVAAAHDTLASLGTTVIVLLIALLFQALMGYLLGLGAGRAAGYAPEIVSAFTFGVGMRNISAGIVIADRFFSPEATLPVILAMLFQQPLASLMHRKLTPRAKGAGGRAGDPPVPHLP